MRTGRHRRRRSLRPAHHVPRWLSCAAGSGSEGFRVEGVDASRQDRRRRRAVGAGWIDEPEHVQAVYPVSLGS